MNIHPLRFLRIMGTLDGLSLITLLFISMPLKYFADLPLFVTVNGSLHGGIFVLYVIAIILVQLRIQWNVSWSVLSVVVAFIPFGNFLLDRKLRKMEKTMRIKPFPTHWLVYAIIFFSFFDLFVQLPIMSTYALSVGKFFTSAKTGTPIIFQCESYMRRSRLLSGVASGMLISHL